MIRQNTGFQRTQWGGLSGAPSRGKRERFLELGLAWVVLEGRASWLERLEETRGLSGPLSTHTLWGWLQPPACNTPTHPVTCTDCYCLILTPPHSPFCRTEILNFWPALVSRSGHVIS